MQNEISQVKAILPALVGAGFCLFFFRSGFLTFFFLTPLGFLAFRYEHKMAWTALFFAVLGNTVFAIGNQITRNIPLTATFLEIFYFGVMTFLFTWTIVPPSIKLPELSEKTSILALLENGAVRFIGACLLGAIMITGIFYHMTSSPRFLDYLNSLLNTFLAASHSSGANLAQIVFLENLTPEALLHGMRSVMIRGGSLVSCIVLFAACRQISILFARISFRINRSQSNISLEKDSLAIFFVNPSVIWVFSASLLLVVLTRIINLVFFEILLWNVLVLCFILYLAQGLGIFTFFLTRSLLSPLVKIALIVIFFVVLFSPALNIVLFIVLFLLGVLENWVPFRASKLNGPPSTPEEGV